MSQQAASASGGSTLAVNRAKQWQIALFPFNNAATNVYFAFYNYFVYWAVLYLTGSTFAAIGGVLVSAGVALAVSTFAAIYAPIMRVFDGITDPILGGIMDKTHGRFGKFRPYMIIGNIMLAFSVLLMMIIAQFVPNNLAPLQWVLYCISYIIYVLGYTCQCAVTKAGQTCLTNDPQQRSQFVIWNMIGMIGSIVLVNVMAGGVLTNEVICPKGLIVYESSLPDGVTAVYSLRELLENLATNNLGLASVEGMTTAELLEAVTNGGIITNLDAVSLVEGGSYAITAVEGGVEISSVTVYSVQGLIERWAVDTLNVQDFAGYASLLDVPTDQLIAAMVDHNIDVNALIAEGLGTAENGGTPYYTYLRGAAYGIQFYYIMVPFVIIVSAIYTVMAVAAIAEKDKPEFWGVSTEKPAKFRDYIDILKSNKEMRWLVLSSGFNKLASTVSTSGAVAFLVYGCLMGDYNGLYIPFYALCFIFMGIFFLWGSTTAGRKGQKRGVAQFTAFAFLFYIGVLIMLCIYNHDAPATHLSLFSMEGGFHLTINAYTIIFIILYGCGYGAFNCCDNLTIPMVADCTDYETYRSGNYLPGIMGTIFSLIDKLISALQSLLLQLFIVLLVPGLTALPAEGTPYMEGMQLSAIICFCLLPMAAWAITIFAMTRYSLSGKRLQEIQAVNAVRKAAVAGGMSMQQAMETWKTIDQVPATFVYNKPPRINKKTGEVIVEKDNILDKIYNFIFTRRERVSGVPSSNAVDIPEEYLTDEVRTMIEEANAKANGGAAAAAAGSETPVAEDNADNSSES